MNAGTIGEPLSGHGLGCLQILRLFQSSTLTSMRFTATFTSMTLATISTACSAISTDSSISTLQSVCCGHQSNAERLSSESHPTRTAGQISALTNPSPIKLNAQQACQVRMSFDCFPHSKTLSSLLN